MSARCDFVLTQLFVVAQFPAARLR